VTGCDDTRIYGHIYMYLATLSGPSNEEFYFPFEFFSYSGVSCPYWSLHNSTMGAGSSLVPLVFKKFPFFGQKG
jgi:hypothetical protein